MQWAPHNAHSLLQWLACEILSSCHVLPQNHTETGVLTRLTPDEGDRVHFLTVTYGVTQAERAQTHPAFSSMASHVPQASHVLL